MRMKSCEASLKPRTDDSAYIVTPTSPPVCKHWLIHREQTSHSTRSGTAPDARGAADNDSRGTVHRGWLDASERHPALVHECGCPLRQVHFYEYVQRLARQPGDGLPASAHWGLSQYDHPCHQPEIWHRRGFSRRIQSIIYFRCPARNCMPPFGAICFQRITWRDA